MQSNSGHVVSEERQLAADNVLAVDHVDREDGGGWPRNIVVVKEGGDVYLLVRWSMLKACPEEAVTADMGRPCRAIEKERSQ